MGLPFLGFSQGGDWCSKHSRCWLLRLYVLFVSVSQRAISFLISDAKLWRILIDSKKFCVFRSQLLRHRGVFCNKSGERWHSCRIPPLKSYSQIVNPTETFSAIRFAVSWNIRIFASDMAKTNHGYLVLYMKCQNRRRQCQICKQKPQNMLNIWRYLDFCVILQQSNR